MLRVMAYQIRLLFSTTKRLDVRIDALERRMRALERAEEDRHYADMGDDL